ncbi:unnamed protein product [Cochlearia groenlandica]
MYLRSLYCLELFRSRLMFRSLKSSVFLWKKGEFQATRAFSSKYHLRSIGFKDALDLFDNMVHSHPIPSIVDFTKLLTSISNMKRYETVINLFHSLETIGISHDLYSFTILIDCYCRCYQQSLALSLLGKMMKLGFKPSIVTLGSLVMTYNTLINGFCKSKRVDDGLKLLKLLDLMVSKGSLPDVVTYNTLINGFCKSKRVEDGMKLFCEMYSDGLIGDTFTYNILIHGFCQAGKLNVAQKIYKRMVDCGVHPDIVTYNILLESLCINGKIEKALAMVEDLQKSEMDVGIITYNIIIQGMCRIGKVEAARRLFCSLALKGVKPDAIAYTTMISGLCRKGRRHEAEKLYRKMKEDGIKPSECMNNAFGSKIMVTDDVVMIGS